jgi:tetratricopeptide (TPR) repeat protein
MHLKHFQLALKAYENALASGGISAHGYCNLGLLYGYRGSPKKALSYYQAALQIDPTHRDAKTNAAHLCLSLGYLKNAKGLFRQLVEEGVRDVDILLALTVIAVRERDWGQVETATQMLEECPTLGDFGNKTKRELFYADVASLLVSQNKPKLSEWAKEIAAGLWNEMS